MLPPEEHVPAGDARMRSAGKALPGVEIVILGPDGQSVPTGEVGEVVTRSSNNMLGYWNLPDATAKTMTDDGWIRTGDAGYLDEDGYLYIHDRMKDMIITGGENRSEEHTSELQSLMRISYAVFCLKKKINTTTIDKTKVQ